MRLLMMSARYSSQSRVLRPLSPFIRSLRRQAMTAQKPTVGSFSGLPAAPTQTAAKPSINKSRPPTGSFSNSPSRPKPLKPFSTILPDRPTRRTDMRQFSHVMGKELKDYFVTPIAYIVITIFVIVTGWFFFSTFFLYNQANLRSFFTLLPLIFSFVVPAIAMRLFAEELSRGSYELLRTMPLTFSDIILGKFLAGLLMTAALLVPTIVYPISIAFLGQLDWGPVVGGYFGALLLG